MHDTDGTPMFPEENIEALPVEISDTERQLYDGSCSVSSGPRRSVSQSDKAYTGTLHIIFCRERVTTKGAADSIRLAVFRNCSVLQR